MFKYKGLKVREEEAELPRTRKELLKTVVRDDFYLLAEISMLMFLFSIPLALVLAGEILLLGGSVGTEAAMKMTICFYCGLVEIPFFGLRYFARYAAFGVMKRRVHN